MGNMLESQQSSVVLKDVDPNALDAIVIYAYTAKIKVCFYDIQKFSYLLNNKNWVTQPTNIGTVTACLGIWHFASLTMSFSTMPEVLVICESE